MSQQSEQGSAILALFFEVRSGRNWCKQPGCGKSYAVRNAGGIGILIRHLQTHKWITLEPTESSIAISMDVEPPAAAASSSSSVAFLPTGSKRSQPSSAALPPTKRQNRQQLTHSSSSASAATLSTELAVPSPLWCQSQDLVVLVYSFLEWDDLSKSAICVSRAWYKCGLLIPSRRIRLDTILSDKSIARLLRSLATDKGRKISRPLQHHVGELSIIDTDPKLSLISQLRALSDQHNNFPHLQSLTVNHTKLENREWVKEIPSCVKELSIIDLVVTISQSEVTLLRFAHQLVTYCPQLTSLTFNIVYVRDSGRKVNHMDIGLTDAFPHEQRCPLKMLTILKQLPDLQDFEYSISQLDFELTPEHYTILRSFPSLTDVRIRAQHSRSSENSLRELKLWLPQTEEEKFGLQPLHFVKLPFMICNQYGVLQLNEESAPVLQQCRWLKTLDLMAPGEPISESNRWHTKFTHLTELDIASVRLDDLKLRSVLYHIHEDTLVHAFSLMPHIATLRFSSARVTSQLLTRCLTQFHQLQTLEFDSLEGLDSLSFIQALPHRIIKFININLQGVKSLKIATNELESQFFHVDKRQWAQLQTIVMIDVFSANISPEMKKKFDWRSSEFDHQRFPYLRTFRDNDDDDDDDDDDC